VTFVVKKNMSEKDEVLVRVDGVGKKFCRSLADEVGCGV
jgi:hypothetical protein